MANYRVTELDFDAIKNNLKTFLTNYRDKNNNLVFSDYDFLQFLFSLDIHSALFCRYLEWPLNVYLAHNECLVFVLVSY